jgi:hypothetical protein
MLRRRERVDSAKLNDWLQVFGIFALVASLIFVGMQMKLDREIALSAIYQARSDASMIIRMAPLESEALLSATAKRVFGSDEELTPEEEVALFSRITGNMIYLENVHFQYMNGFISEEHWQTNREEIKQLMRMAPGRRKDYIDNGCPFLRESFCAEVRRGAEIVEAEMR